MRLDLPQPQRHLPAEQRPQGLLVGLERTSRRRPELGVVHRAVTLAADQPSLRRSVLVATVPVIVLGAWQAAGIVADRRFLAMAVQCLRNA